jgi:hypothetical protein
MNVQHLKKKLKKNISPEETKIQWKNVEVFLYGKSRKIDRTIEKEESHAIMKHI